MDVIPAPRAVLKQPGVSRSISATTSVSATDASIRPIINWFTAEVTRFTSIALSGGAGTGSEIVFALDERLASVLTTNGVRADNEAIDSERYTLEVRADGIRIVGSTLEGFFRGATTLLHLIASAAVDGVAELEGIIISDAPRFAWRGLSMDVVRTFHPVETVKKVIDLLALYKMNVLHLHLTDAEGWRFEVPDYPALIEVSGKTARDGRPGGYFSKDEYSEILDYAAARFITVVPEFDSPGHTASVLRAYPELGSSEMHAAPEAMRYLDPAVPGVWDFVRAVYTEMARVHPGARIHVGGDEAIAMDEQVFARYMETVLSTARATGKGVVAWQETARAGFAEGDLMQWWISPHLFEVVRQASEDPAGAPFANMFPDPDVGEAFVKLLLQAPEDLPKALAQGADVIISRADKLYLDTKYTEPSADPEQEADHQRVGLPPMVYGNGTVEDSYAWDPATLDPELPLDRIAGIEAAVWCETIADQRDLMLQLLPRLPGVAERGWSDPHEWSHYHPRLATQRRFWDSMELNYFVSSVVCRLARRVTPNHPASDPGNLAGQMGRNNPAMYTLIPTTGSDGGDRQASFLSPTAHSGHSDVAGGALRLRLSLAHRSKIPRLQGTLHMARLDCSENACWTRTPTLPDVHEYVNACDSTTPHSEQSEKSNAKRHRPET